MSQLMNLPVGSNLSEQAVNEYNTSKVLPRDFITLIIDAAIATQDMPTESEIRISQNGNHYFFVDRKTVRVMARFVSEGEAVSLWQEFIQFINAGRNAN